MVEEVWAWEAMARAWAWAEEAASLAASVEDPASIEEPASMEEIDFI